MNRIPPPPPPKKPAHEQQSVKINVYVKPGVAAEIRKLADRNGSNVSREINKAIDAMLAGEAEQPTKLEELDRVREIMRDRGVNRKTAEILADAERGG